MEGLFFAAVVVVLGLAATGIYFGTRKPKPDGWPDPLRDQFPSELVMEQRDVQFVVVVPRSVGESNEFAFLLQNCTDAPRTFAVEWRVHTGPSPADLGLERAETKLDPMEAGTFTIPVGRMKDIAKPTDVILVVNPIVSGDGGKRLRVKVARNVAPLPNTTANVALGLVAGFTMGGGLTARFGLEPGPRTSSLGAPSWTRLWKPEASALRAHEQGPTVI